MLYIFRNLVSLMIAMAISISLFYAQPASAQPWGDAGAPATILRVDGEFGSATGDGSDWGSSAFKYLQDAITAAPFHVPPVDIWVRGGATVPPYRPDQGGVQPSNPREATFRMANQVRWYGGFAGDETGDAAGFIRRDYRANLTILCGDIGILDVIDLLQVVHHWSE